MTLAYIFGKADVLPELIFNYYTYQEAGGVVQKASKPNGEAPF
jgi:hypothetical protein